MTRPVLHSVPSDPATPYPVSWARVMGTFSTLVEDSDSVVDEGNSAAIIYQGHPFTAGFVTGQGYLSVRLSIPFSLENQGLRFALFSSMNTWNREHYFPTLYSRPRSESIIEAVADMVIDIRWGLSDAQLRDELITALFTGVEAAEYLSWVAEQVESLE